MESHKKDQILGKMNDLADEVCFIFDINQNRFEYVNEAFQTVTKRESTELFKNPKLLFKLIHEDDRVNIKHAFNLLLEKKTKSFLDFRICRPDKTERWIRLKVYPIIEAKKIAYLTGTAEDDTARKSTVINMQKVNGWKDSNLEVLAHDLRGPIGTVQMLSSILRKKLPENKEVQKLTQMIEDISKSSIILIQNLLTREILDTAEVEAGLERFDVVWEIHQVMDIYLESQDNIQKHISYTHSHDQIFAEIDSMKFLQIVNNLVSNAIKFTHDNGLIKVHVEQLEETFLLTVNDDGIGIPKSLQPALFKKYTKSGRTGVKDEESIGLGMWIVKTLTEVHKGRVWFESEPRKGSTFYVEIPLGL
ncbi:two-component system sensor histidine kinase VicK [Pedobacter sp. CG_S7]|uniref:PAS domain-containing sensor histidine kinase n=1 Tax=Pedobacter sp. CG_S7 TaxID=3143930 RepID=UPI003399282D